MTNKSAMLQEFFSIKRVFTETLVSPAFSSRCWLFAAQEPPSVVFSSINLAALSSRGSLDCCTRYHLGIY